MSMRAALTTAGELVGAVVVIVSVGSWSPELAGVLAGGALIGVSYLAGDE